MDGLANTLVRAAAADVAAHGIVDVSVRRVGFFGKQRGSGHDLPWLAIAALRNIFLHPGFLHGVAPIGGKTFDGGHFLARNTRNRGDTGTRRFAVDMHRTSSAKGHATAELRAGHVQRVAEHPEQWHVRADIYGLGLAVQGKADSHGGLLKQGHILHQLTASMKIYAIPPGHTAECATTDLSPCAQDSQPRYSRVVFEPRFLCLPPVAPWPNSESW